MRYEASEPLLSVVVTTRNDNHGGDLNRRTQLFLDSLSAQAERHRVYVELVVVEWNPPKDRSSIAEELRWPANSGYFDARIIVVPESLHQRLAHSDRLLLFQMIAKNVGIRRARGRYVLATNVDVLFSHDLIRYLTRQRLSERALYRADRYDVESNVPLRVSLDERLAWCDAHLLRICKREGTYDVREERFDRIYESFRVPLWFAGYLRLWRYIWGRFCASLKFAGRETRAVIRSMRLRLRGAVFSLTAKALGAVRALARRAGGVHFSHLPTPARIARRLERWASKLAATLRARAAREQIVLASERRRLRLPRLKFLTSSAALRMALKQTAEEWALLRSTIVGERARLRLHTNACGDFTLMSRSAWEKVGGYPELELFSMHIDSILLYQAYYSGIEEAFIPHRLYHIEHAGGFSPDPEEMSKLNTRLEEDAIPQISVPEFLEDVIEMYHTKRPKFPSSATWGFSTEILGETWPVRREQPELAAGARAARVSA